MSFAFATAFGSSMSVFVPIMPSVSYSGPGPVRAYSSGSITLMRRWQPVGQYWQGSGLACST